MTATIACYQDDVSSQLSEAEAELAFLEQRFAEFLAGNESSLWGWTGSVVEETVSTARTTIASSITQLRVSFLEAVGGQPIAWDIWWELAKDTEKHMGTVSTYNNTYGSVGGRLDVVSGEVGREVSEKIDGVVNDIKEALPSEGKLWLGVGVVVLVLFLVLAIKLS